MEPKAFVCMIQIMALIISRDLQRLFKGLYFSFVGSHRGHENSLNRTKRKLFVLFYIFVGSSVKRHLT